MTPFPFMRAACPLWGALLLMGFSAGIYAQEPALPRGLGGGRTEAPPLPAGLGEPHENDAPALPVGLGGDQASAPAGPPPGRSLRDRLPVQISGFAEARAGIRTGQDPAQKGRTLSEVRMQLSAETRWGGVAFKGVADGVYDDLAPSHRVDLEKGEGWLDVRQAHLTFTPLSSVDVKAGRQILTWGTGDLLFINDFFPKDWRSFLTGRDEEYLKAPSDAVKASFFGSWANLDLVYTPRFDADRAVDGRRLSIYNPATGDFVGRESPFPADPPREIFQDDEWAMRLHRTLGANELALYGYDGFWKSPGGQRADGVAVFPRLRAFGASARGPGAGGILHAEMGYLDSKDDEHGADPLINNSEWRALVGYERDLRALARDFTVGVQSYVEILDDYDAYRLALPEPIPPRDEVRQVLTLRLTKLLLRQTLMLSAFVFYSPTDQDAYLRPRARLDVTDAWTLEAGGQFFVGEDPHTFFGQFDANDSLYLASRFSF